MKILYFQAEAPSEEEENFHDANGGPLLQFDNILSSLSVFPHLKTLVIDFDFQFNNGNPRHWYDMQTFSYYDEYVEAREIMDTTEEQEGWRALVNLTLEAVSRNKSGAVRDLVYKEEPFTVNSVFSSLSFDQVRQLDQTSCTMQII